MNYSVIIAVCLLACMFTTHIKSMDHEQPQPTNACPNRTAAEINLLLWTMHLRCIEPSHHLLHVRQTSADNASRAALENERQSMLSQGGIRENIHFYASDLINTLRNAIDTPFESQEEAQFLNQDVADFQVALNNIRACPLLGPDFLAERNTAENVQRVQNLYAQFVELQAQRDLIELRRTRGFKACLAAIAMVIAIGLWKAYASSSKNHREQQPHMA